MNKRVQIWNFLQSYVPFSAIHKQLINWIWCNS